MGEDEDARMLQQRGGSNVALCGMSNDERDAFTYANCARWCVLCSTSDFKHDEVRRRVDGLLHFR